MYNFGGAPNKLFTNTVTKFSVTTKYNLLFAKSGFFFTIPDSFRIHALALSLCCRRHIVFTRLDRSILREPSRVFSRSSSSHETRPRRSSPPCFVQSSTGAGIGESVFDSPFWIAGRTLDGNAAAATLPRSRVMLAWRAAGAFTPQQLAGTPSAVSLVLSAVHPSARDLARERWNVSAMPRHARQKRIPQLIKGIRRPFQRVLRTPFNRAATGTCAAIHRPPLRLSNYSRSDRCQLYVRGPRASPFEQPIVTLARDSSDSPANDRPLCTHSFQHRQRSSRCNVCQNFTTTMRS